MRDVEVKLLEHWHATPPRRVGHGVTNEHVPLQRDILPDSGNNSLDNTPP